MPTKSDDRISLVRVKVERAKKHVNDLERELITCRYDSMYIAMPDAQFYAGKGRIGIPSEPPSLPLRPFDVLPAIGEVVHNLRSALDHLAFFLVLANGQIPSNQTAFPIAENCTAYKAMKRGKVKGMRSEAKKLIDRIKPYKGGNTALWRIHELNRIDKHRTLLGIGSDRIYWADWLGGSTFRLKKDAPEFSAEFDTDVEQDMQLEIDEAVSKAKVSNSNAVLPTLHQLIDVTEGIVLEFRPFL